MKKSLNKTEEFTLNEYIAQFRNVLAREGVYLTNAELSDFVPKWLGGTLGSIGFSLPLYAHFYSTDRAD